MNIGSTHAISGKFETEALSVVSVQTAPISAKNLDDVNKNIQNILDYMDRAVGGFPGVDLIVTVECALQGFGPDWQSTVVSEDGPEIQRLKDKCKDLNVWGIFNPILDEYEGRKCCNTAIMINNEGEIVHHYVKMNPWTPGEPTHPGWKCPTTPGPKGSKIATIICADGDYPEIWREAASGGANVIVRVSHYMAPWDRAWEITNKGLAYTTQSYVVTANSVGIDECYSYFGRSMILNPDGTILTEAPYGIEWLTKADLYPSIIDKMREEQVTSNFPWTYKHRGAAHPSVAGEGANLDSYSNKNS
ncbi:MAG: hypothetical protein LBN22_09835 [Clostridiales Family XIII bacterium]|jgi:amidase/formamidase|nr:hypothetical protein [Clostridiales Family XIII bacterium]